jgi:DNA primase
MITKVIASGEFKQNTVKLMQDSLKLIKKNNLERQRERIMLRIRQFNPVTEEDKEQLQQLLSKKMDIDKKLQQ